MGCSGSKRARHLVWCKGWGRMVCGARTGAVGGARQLTLARRPPPPRSHTQPPRSGGGGAAGRPARRRPSRRAALCWQHPPHQARAAGWVGWWGWWGGGGVGGGGRRTRSRKSPCACLCVPARSCRLHTLPHCRPPPTRTGDSGVGKSCLVQRAVHGQFDHHKPATIGAAFLSHTVALPGGQSVKFEIWCDRTNERASARVRMHAFVRERHACTRLDGQAGVAAAAPQPASQPARQPQPLAPARPPPPPAAGTLQGRSGTRAWPPYTTEGRRRQQ